MVAVTLFTCDIRHQVTMQHFRLDICNFLLYEDRITVNLGGGGGGGFLSFKVIPIAMLFTLGAIWQRNFFKHIQL